MVMKIDKKLNLVLEVEQDTGRTTDELDAAGKPTGQRMPVLETLYAHSEPVAETIFERYDLLLGEVISELYGRSIGIGMASRLALSMVRKIALKEGPGYYAEVEKGLLAEIERLTSVIVLDKEKGWTPLPVETANRANLISDRERKEVLSYATFFTASSWLQNAREQRDLVWPVLTRLYGAQITSSTATEFAASLRTSTPAVSTGERKDPEAPQSLVPV